MDEGGERKQSCNAACQLAYDLHPMMSLVRAVRATWLVAALVQGTNEDRPDEALFELQLRTSKSLS